MSSVANRRSFAIVGLGHRSRIYSQALLGAYADRGRLVALCDDNPGRLARAASLTAVAHDDAATFLATDFDQMIAATRPDCVIVTSPDHTHSRYIVGSLEHGCDVITEKPLAVDAESCRRIVAAREASGRAVTVTFNYRYSPARGLLKQVLTSGIIGRVTTVEFAWHLDTDHGADYFRRWHRKKANSGGLFVQKSTHHFDLLNWWLGSVPRRIAAHGARVFYRPETAVAFGLDDRGERCSDCRAASRCKFRLDILGDPYLRSLYLENEGHDGYLRDRCVFAGESDIEDSMRAEIEYENGVLVNYSLTAFNPSEGYRVVFYGTRGRIVHEIIERTHLQPNGRRYDPPLEEQPRIVVQPLFERPFDLALPVAEGMHSGGDKLLLAELFGGVPSKEYAADERAGAWSALVGIAANVSLAADRPVLLDEIAGGVAKPDLSIKPFGKMPEWRDFDPARYWFLEGAKNPTATA